MKNIPVNEPLLNGNEEKYLVECIRTGWISSEGPFVSKFEEQMAVRVNRKHAIAVSNGSVALDTAIIALGIKKGDEVIMPAFTIISCASAILRAGAKPVLIDSDKDTWNIDVNKIEEKITSRTKAIMVVHIYGLPVQMDAILFLAKKYSLKIIEDAAEMHGQNYNNIPCGSFGDISVFSFYPNKHITTGEGGMILTNDSDIEVKCRALRNLYFNNDKRFVHEELGWNYRMTNLQAAVGVAQLERLDEFIRIKRKIGKLYTDILNTSDKIQLPVKSTSYAENIYWVYGVVIKDKDYSTAKNITEKLNNVGIGTRPFFFPMHMQPVFKKMGLFLNESYPVAENLYNYGFYLPSGMALKENDLTFSANTLLKILE
jgi:perosamine synthetase